MNYRFATASDSALLAAMNQELIRDEGHSNRMTASELERRMNAWLNAEYQAVVFERDAAPAGYVLYREESEYIYLRQFYVRAECRRQGVGRSAIEWMLANVWSGAAKIRLDVLTGNAVGIAFWHAAGFRDYALTMERAT